MAHDVFISYSTKDKTIADAVCAKLEENKIRVWIAPRDVAPGSNFAASIIHAINNSKVFILIWSANTSEHILNEINQAFDQGITIIPFRIQDIQPTDEMRYYFGRTHWLDAINPPLEKHIAILKDTVLVNLDPERQAAIHAQQTRQESGKTSPNQELPDTEKTEELKSSGLPSPQKKGRELKKGYQPVSAASAASPPPPQSSGTESTPQKKQTKLKNIWIWGGSLVILALAIGSAVFWLKKMSLPAHPTINPATVTHVPAVNTSIPQGETIIVTSVEDSGPGTLRQALLDAQSGDTITFDPEIFPPDKPNTIFTTSIPLDKSSLPRIAQGNITIDASNAGVVLDGSKLQGDSLLGLVINSNNNTVMGLKIINFNGIGIYLEGGDYNTIGGDRNIGSGPAGQGNLIINNSIGISVLPDAIGNLFTGNLIGTDASGTGSMGNWRIGIQIEAGPADQTAPNIIGPDNVIAYNGTVASAEGDPITGGVVINSGANLTTITANSIYNNTGPGIFYNLEVASPINYLTPPVIIYFDLASGIVNGHTDNNTSVEIFSTDTQDGKIFEGTVTADEFGNFSFRKGEALGGPFLTATAWSPGHSTSEFSQPTNARSDIQIALDALQDQAPLFQTSFDYWDAGWDSRAASMENGKLILSSENQDGATVGISNLYSDRYAIEYEFSVRDTGVYSHCVAEMGNTVGDRYSSFVFFGNGEIALNSDRKDIAWSSYDETQSHKVTLIILGDQRATFVDGQISFTALDPNGSAFYTYQALSAYYKIVCEIDNYKIWDLTGVELNP